MARTKISAKRNADAAEGGAHEKRKTSAGKQPKRPEKSVKSAKSIKSIKTVRDKAEKKLKDKIDGKDVTQNPETGEVVKVKKAHRWRPGTAALREIRRLQKSTDELVPHAPFLRVVREVLQDRCPTGMRITANCARLLHQIAEDFIHEVVQATQVAAVANGRVQPKAHDFRLALALNPSWKQYVPQELNRVSATQSELKKQFAIREYLRVYSRQSPEEAKLAKEKADLLRHNRDLLRQEHRVKDNSSSLKKVKIAKTSDTAVAAAEQSNAEEDKKSEAVPMEESPAEAAAEAAPEPAETTKENGHANGVEKPKKPKTKKTASRKVPPAAETSPAAAAAVDAVEF